MKKATLLLFITAWIFNSLFAQDDLIKKISGNKSDSAKKAFQFTTLINLANTPVQNQGSSGTCWSYSTNSFLESEMIKAGKKPVVLSKIYTARCAYEEKAANYVKMNGALNWGDGGEPNDVVNMYAKYGAIPESVYSGLLDGAKLNNFAEMQAVIKAMLEAIVKNPAGTLSPYWKQAIKGVLDAYLGVVPATFQFEGKSYTAQSFAKEYVGLHPKDYVPFMSQNNTPYWEKAMFMVPDNWAFDWCWNIPQTDLTVIIDNALKNGYTVEWATDVSEPYFSWVNGVAFVPQDPTSYRGKLSEWQKAELFNGPKAEPAITADMRQLGLENTQTTDDHGMHIVGLAKDQTGKEYYIVKNSWGQSNDYQGYLYVTKPYVQYKSTGILVNKNAIPTDIRKKIGI